MSKQVKVWPSGPPCPWAYHCTAGSQSLRTFPTRPVLCITGGGQVGLKNIRIHHSIIEVPEKTRRPGSGVHIRGLRRVGILSLAFGVRARQSPTYPSANHATPKSTGSTPHAQRRTRKVFGCQCPSKSEFGRLALKPEAQPQPNSCRKLNTSIRQLLARTTGSVLEHRQDVSTHPHAHAFGPAQPLTPMTPHSTH